MIFAFIFNGGLHVLIYNYLLNIMYFLNVYVEGTGRTVM